MFSTYKRLQVAAMFFLVVLGVWVYFGFFRNIIPGLLLRIVAVHLLGFGIIFLLPLDGFRVNFISGALLFLESLIFLIIDCALRRHFWVGIFEFPLLCFSLIYIFYCHNWFGYDF